MVYLLGCDHYLQEYDLTEPDEEVRTVECTTKKRFYDLTSEIMQREGIQFVGEECKPGQRTIPRVVASECACSYTEIDMPLQERERRGIPRNYQGLGEPERVRGYAMREDFMVERTYSQSTVDTNKLIVCGGEHLKGLETRFAQRGETVVTRNLTSEEWVVEVHKKRLEKL